MSLGLGALLQVSELAHTIVKWAGAAYLFWLGAHLLFKPRQAFVSGDAPSQQSAAIALRKGFLTNLLNPKVGIFYVSFIPQFVPYGASVAGYTFFLATVHVVLTLAWFTLVAPLGRMLRKPKVISALDRLTGLVFIGFGLKLVSSKA